MTEETTSPVCMLTSPVSGYESEKEKGSGKAVSLLPSDTRKTAKMAKVSSTNCPVCGELATSHRHYGGLSCLSCKAFFRRAVTSTNKKGKKCQQGGGEKLCSVQRGQKRACPACRLSRCRESGMKAELVLSGRKEALKHIGRANESTLVKLKMLLEVNQDESSEKMVIEDAVCKSDETIKDVSQNVLKLHESEEDSDNSADDKTKKNESEDLNIVDTQRVIVDKESGFISSLEQNFLMAREKVSMFSSRFSVEQLLAESSLYCPALVFTSVQDYVVQLVVIFLKHNHHFQSHSWVTQAKLLRKNLPEMTVILMTLCFDKKKQSIKWVLSMQDLETIRSYRATQQQTVEITKKCLLDHLGEEVTGYVMEAVNTLADLQLPNCILLVLVLVAVFTRDGLFMDKQNRVDSQRAEYLQMVFRFLSSMQSRDASSRITAKLHKTLKILKDFSENIRHSEVNSVIFE